MVKTMPAFSAVFLLRARLIQLGDFSLSVLHDSIGCLKRSGQNDAGRPPAPWNDGFVAASMPPLRHH
jgi:hypothetical protein